MIWNSSKKETTCGSWMLSLFRDLPSIYYSVSIFVSTIQRKRNNNALILSRIWNSFTNNLFKLITLPRRDELDDRGKHRQQRLILCTPTRLGSVLNNRCIEFYSLHMKSLNCVRKITLLVIHASKIKYRFTAGEFFVWCLLFAHVNGGKQWRWVFYCFIVAERRCVSSNRIVYEDRRGCSRRASVGEKFCPKVSKKYKFRPQMTNFPLNEWNKSIKELYLSSTHSLALIQQEHNDLEHKGNSCNSSTVMD